MDLLGFGASVLGGLFESSSAQDAYENQMKMLERQIEANKETMQNRHQWEVADLRQAGLNPLMSVTSPTGTLSAPSPASVQKANIAQSALAMSQVATNNKMAEAALVNADANKIGAEAKMIEANNDTNRTNFQMGPEFELKTQVSNAEMNNIIAQTGLANSQTALNLLQKEWIPKLMQADLNYKEMQIAMLELVERARAVMFAQQGEASLISANAQAYHASSYARSVDIAAELGIKQGELYSAEKEKASAEASKIVLDSFKTAREKAYLEGLDKNDTYRFMKTWKYALGDIPIFGNIGDYLGGYMR